MGFRRGPEGGGKAMPPGVRGVVGIKCCTMRFAFNWKGILFLDNLFIALTFQNCFNPCIFSIF